MEDKEKKSKKDKANQGDKVDQVVDQLSKKELDDLMEFARNRVKEEEDAKKQRVSMAFSVYS